MTRRPLPRCLALLAPAAACLAAGLAAAPGADAAPLRYVALGDSYSAASGVFPLAPGSPPMCLRSSANYPHVLAARIGATLTDVSCGAAETKDFFVAQYSGLDPQLDALSANTQLVTMTIGGNDSGVFINTILQCGSAGILSLGQGSPCRDQQGSKPEDTIRNVTYPAIVRALQAVRPRPRTRRSASSAIRGSSPLPAGASTRCRSPPATCPTSVASRRRSTTRSGAPRRPPG